MGIRTITRPVAWSQDMMPCLELAITVRFYEEILEISQTSNAYDAEDCDAGTHLPYTDLMMVHLYTYYVDMRLFGLAIALLLMELSSIYHDC